MVPKAGFEPARHLPRHFKCRVSTSSTTYAYSSVSRTTVDGRNHPAVWRVDGGLEDLKQRCLSYISVPHFGSTTRAWKHVDKRIAIARAHNRKQPQPEVVWFRASQTFF